MIRQTRYVAPFAAAVVIVAASSAAATDTSAPADSDPAAAAAARVEGYLEDSGSIGLDTPLSGVPEEGVQVYWLEGNIPPIIALTPGFESATDALGWDLTVVSYDPADAQGPSAAVQQAVSGGADYIAISGQPIPALGEGLEAAKEAGIPVINMFSTDEPGGAENGIYANVGGVAHTQHTGQALADYVIADSGGEAHVLFTSVPDFPILQIFAEASLEQYESMCPDCTVTPMDVSIADMTSGATTSLAISAMQTNPEINYVSVAIGFLSTGLPEALDAADMEAGIVGWGPELTQIQYLIDDQATAFVQGGNPSASWYAVDVMARLSLGMDPQAEEHDALPIAIWTPENTPEPAAMYQGPDGYEDQFKALWGLA